MKKSLIAIAALGIMSSSAFAESQNADVNFDVNVLSSCTFDNLYVNDIIEMHVSGYESYILGDRAFKRTCSLGMPYLMYVDNTSINLDNSNSVDANGEVLRVTAYLNQVGGELAPVKTGGTQGSDKFIGTGEEQSDILAFELTNAAGGRVVNRHVQDTGKITLTVEYVPQ